MIRNPPSNDEYQSIGSSDFDQILKAKAARAERKEAERKALSNGDVRRIDEANLEVMKKLFERYGGHRRYVSSKPLRQDDEQCGPLQAYLEPANVELAKAESDLEAKEVEAARANLKASSAPQS